MFLDGIATEATRDAARTFLDTTHTHEPCSSLRRLRESRQRSMRNPYIDRYGLKASREPAARPVRASPSKSASRNTVFPECRTRIAAHDASRRRAAPR